MKKTFVCVRLKKFRVKLKVVYNFSRRPDGDKKKRKEI
jgi:predicted transport protein